MLSVRVVGTARTLLNPGRLLTGRQCVSRGVTCALQCKSGTLSEKDTRHSILNLTPPERNPELLHNVKNYCTAPVTQSCWNCRRALDQTPAFFCMLCKVVQAPVEGVSYFQIMDCDYTFALDTQKLQKRYFQLQRSLHPDNFSQKSETEQEYSQRQSALVNKAYWTLLKPLSRGLYMLELQGLRIEEGTDSGADSEFLMELMEINEALDAAPTPKEANEIGRETKGINMLV